MQRTNTWLVFSCALSMTITACGDNVDFGDFDGSFDFDDAGDAGSARRDAATKHEDGGRGDGGGVGRDAGLDAGAVAGDDASVPDDPQLPAKLARALCDALADCYHSAALRDDVLGGHDCVTLNENALANSELRYLPDSIEAGLVRFDASKLGDCTSDIRALGCKARASRLPGSCKAALAGTLLIAGECTINLDCQGEAFCDKGALASCPGVCSPLQPEGFPCNHDDDNQCKDGLVCFRGTCEALRAVEQTCGDTEQPGCAPGLACVDLVGDGLQCVAIDALYTTALGDACDPTDELERCKSGLVCESVSDTAGVCAKPVGAGASCKRAQPNQCPVGQYCDAVPGETGTCVDAPGDGEPCSTRTPPCAEGHLCIEQVCRPLRDNGAACLTDRQCYSGTCADAVCEAPLQCEAP